MNAPNDTALAGLKLSRRAESLGTENAFVVLAEVNALVRQGKDIVSFCIGQPDFPTPENIRQAGIAAIEAGKHGYTPSAGIDELRTAAAKDLATRRGLDVQPDDVVIGAGAKPFIAYTIVSTTDHGVGDEVIYPNPAHDFFKLELPGNNTYDIIIIDETGRSVFEEKNMHAQSQINCEKFPNGIYFVKARSDNKLLVEKFIKH